ncbi:MAG TPA: hypothetical protein VIU16_02985, partial [Gaiellaceae bacterium]
SCCGTGERHYGPPVMTSDVQLGKLAVPHCAVMPCEKNRGVARDIWFTTPAGVTTVTVCEVRDDGSTYAWSAQSQATQTAGVGSWGRGATSGTTGATVTAEVPRSVGFRFTTPTNSAAISIRVKCKGRPGVYVIPMTLPPKAVFAFLSGTGGSGRGRLYIIGRGK